MSEKETELRKMINTKNRKKDEQDEKENEHTIWPCICFIHLYISLRHGISANNINLENTIGKINRKRREINRTRDQRETFS